MWFESLSEVALRLIIVSASFLSLKSRLMLNDASLILNNSCIMSTSNRMVSNAMNDKSDEW